jgi:hypothetical protein
LPRVRNSGRCGGFFAGEPSYPTGLREGVLAHAPMIRFCIFFGIQKRGLAMGKRRAAASLSPGTA